MYPADSTLRSLKILLTHQGKANCGGVLLPVTVRLSGEIYGYVEAMTQTATPGTSRNMIVNELLALAIQTLLDDSPTELNDSLTHLAAQILGTRLNPGSLPEFDKKLSNELPTEIGEI